MRRFFQKKVRILIFGTGAGGSYFYKYNRSHYDVVGFLDNNPQKHDQKLFGKLIYAPQKLSELVYDKIIIASDYYREILTQLTDLLLVPKARIEVFLGADVQKPRSLLQRLGKHLESLGYERMCKQSGLVSDVLYWLLCQRVNQQSNRVNRLSLRWLDQVTDYKVHVFRTAESGVTQGPKFIGLNVPPTPIVLPEVALYNFQHAQVGSVSRALILPGGQVIVERVTTSSHVGADYSGGHLLYHGQTLALVRTGEPERVEKGILISGCTELNYYHWVSEILSQLQFVPELPAQYADYPILIAAGSQKIPSIKTLIEAIGVKRKLLFLTNMQSYRVDDLLLISAPNNLIPNFKGDALNSAETTFSRPESIRFLRDKAMALATEIPRSTLPKRVFLARKAFLRSYNQQEIRALLDRYGFESVYMEEQDISHQVAIMANAEVIIGPTGAAWTNIMFASQNTKALCWMAEEYLAFSSFSNLAAIVGVEMDYITYRVGSSDSRELYYRSYHVDVDLVSRWLEQNVAVISDGHV